MSELLSKRPHKRRIAGAVIAGGRSVRMGEEKALLAVGGRTIVARVIERLRPQVTTVVINANGPATQFRGLGLTIVADLRNDVRTPLAGLHAALAWARSEGYVAVLTAPSDCPFLPRDLVSRLTAAKAPAVARSGGQTHVLTGLWPCGLQEMLEQAMDGGMYRVKDWVVHAPAVTVDWPMAPYDPFFNVNTPEDLAQARRIAAEFDP